MRSSRTCMQEIVAEAEGESGDCLKAAMEEARQRRVGRTLSKFWQTQPRFTKQDGVFLAVMGAAITLTIMTWTSMAANRKERRV